MMLRPPARAVAAALAAVALLYAPAASQAPFGGHRGGWGRGGPVFHARGPGGDPGYRGAPRALRGDGPGAPALRGGHGAFRNGGPGYRGGYGYGYGDRGRGGPGGRRFRCRNSGTGGTIIGAIAGGLLGNSIAGYGDRAAGTIVGAGGGALAGRAIDRDC